MEDTLFRKAMDSAGRMLSYRPLTCEQLREKLIHKEYEPKIVAAVLERLVEYGYLDDEAYAYRAVEVLQKKGYGLTRIRQELWRRGLDRETTDQALLNYKTNENRLDEMLGKKLKGQTDFKELQKAAASLYRKGYTWEEIRGAMERYKAEGNEV